MDLGHAIEAEIAAEVYPCLICHSEIGPKSPIWSCRHCYRVYDIQCIRAWARKSMDSAPVSNSSVSKEWKCPHCLHAYSSRTRIQYRCWCGKSVNPSPEPGIAPHSCAQSCNSQLRCPHPCTLRCHAGPHVSPCPAMGPTISCYCGKHSIQTTCPLTPYGGWTCQDKCGRKHAKCGHPCRKNCHKGKCGPCRVKLPGKCWCGYLENQGKKVMCKDLPATGKVSCGRTCNQILDCGVHHCSRQCHSHDGNGTHRCPQKPVPGERCPCGKTPVTMILGHARSNCEEQVPVCNKTCGKSLGCGHQCQATCHRGTCPPCTAVAAVPCQCGSRHMDHKCGDPVPTCLSKCGASLNCGRHRCSRRCCPLRPMAEERTKRLNFDDYLDLDYELEGHRCERVCGRKLSCGIHTCTQPCHLGKCPPCLQSSSEDWSCPCGRTIMRAPITCGTPMPECYELCPRPRSCGHEPLHKCHPDTVPCPPCKIIKQVPCACGSTSFLRNCAQLQENSEPPLCTELCGAQLSCGHTCSQRCCTIRHSNLESNLSAVNCGQPCRVELPCGHQCQMSCHTGTPHEECQRILWAYCPCSNLKLQYECGEKLEIGCNDTCDAERYDNVLLQAWVQNPHWCADIERTVRTFIAADSRVLRFKPMRKSARRFVHYLLEHCGLDGVSVDSGAQRSVIAYRTDRTRLPRVRLGKAAEATRKHPSSTEITALKNEVVPIKPHHIKVDDQGWTHIVGNAPHQSTAPSFPVVSSLGSIYDVLQ